MLFPSQDSPLPVMAHVTPPVKTFVRNLDMMYSAWSAGMISVGMSALPKSTSTSFVAIEEPGALDGVRLELDDEALRFALLRPRMSRNRSSVDLLPIGR